MLTVKEESTIMGVTELRTKTRILVDRLKRGKVILTKRNKPQAVVISYDEYQAMEEIIDAFEDYVLGHMAKERAERKDKRLITLKEAEKRVGL